MKKLLTLLLVMVCSVGWCAGTTVETSGKSTIQTGPASFTNFVQLGASTSSTQEVGPFTGALSNTEGGSVIFAHNLDESKIIGYSILAKSSLGYYFPDKIPDGNTGCTYTVYFYNNKVYITNHATDSELILQASYTMYIKYRL